MIKKQEKALFDKQCIDIVLISATEKRQQTKVYTGTPVIEPGIVVVSHASH